MTEKESKYLSDILSAIDLIEDFVKGINSFNAYKNDQKTKSAVERQLVIIGEAVNNFLRTSTANKLENAGKIIGFRNRLVHAYDSVDDNIVWVIIQKHLEPLKLEIREKTG